MSVGEAMLTVYTNGARMSVFLPDAVRRFVAAFDVGGYDSLYRAGHCDPEARAA